jgi:hypothetical protein
MLFGNKKRLEELEAENVNLRRWYESFAGMEAIQLAQQIDASRAELVSIGQQIAGRKTELQEARKQLSEVQATIVETDEIALLQEVGIYKYRHPLDDAVAYQKELARTKEAIKGLVKDGEAVECETNWQVNGSTREGQKMGKDLSKLMLRAYNAEADNIVRTLKPHTLDSAIARLDKSRDAIAKLGRIVNMEITDAYHSWRTYELKLTADYLMKVEEEKERLREERAQQREEEKALREFQAEKARLAKEQSHYQSALEKLRAKGDEAGAQEMEGKLAQIEAAITGIEDREANIRAGYVYVISNFGSFGQHVVKIGLTRRLEPMDRIRELGDASVPFNFDVHTLVFSEDAVGLESKLHSRLADKRVNLVNLRREYFYATPHEVKECLEAIGGQQLLEFHEVPECVEWRASGGEDRLDALVSSDVS